MVKTVGEFKSEVNDIRKEIRKKGKKADVKLVASWLDKLLISIEDIAPTLDLMQVEIEELSKSGKMKKSKKTKTKKSKKTKKKKSKKRKKKESLWPF